MSQQYPPQQPQPNQPFPPQQPYPPQGANPPYPPHPQPPYGAPGPQPPKKGKAGKIAGLGCLGVIVIAVIAGVATGGGSGSDDKGGKDKTAVAENKPNADAAQKPADKGEAKPDDKSTPVEVTAKKTAFSKSILAQDGSAYTSVLVMVTNNGSEAIDVNPLFFSITDTAGTKHASELAVDEKQIDTVKLAPGENVSGTITGKGSFTAKYVTYTDGLLGDPLRADVS
ncbi:DUF4352 domain-containing protein [Streptomyces sp. NPDC003299]